MANFKCKMCGGELELIANETVAECVYCGTKQTVPNADSEKKMTLFSRANRLRYHCEFDKGANVYESIVAEFPEEAEAYWGLVLCKYGIEYVDDPASGKKIPTCHRSSFESVMEDENLELALEYADSVAKRIYREEAKQIEEIRKGIVEVSSKEEPYDVFICYKETDEQGERTLDSVLAQDIYTELSEKGYRVFFSRITLEEKLGQEYEPYIFAALHSARVMLAIGTSHEYYDAVWVKNEWSRYLKLIAAGEKKTLIPCYKNLDAYDMPREFAKLQAQDMGKVGALQDLMRGIDKLLSGEKTLQKTTEAAIQYGGPTSESYMKRGYIALGDSEWEKAERFFEQALDIDPENGEAYLGLALKNKEHNTLEDILFFQDMEELQEEASYVKAKKYAKNELKAKLQQMELKFADQRKAGVEEIEGQIEALSKALDSGKERWSEYCITEPNWKEKIRKIATLSTEGRIMGTNYGLYVICSNGEIAYLYSDKVEHYSVKHPVAIAGYAESEVAVVLQENGKVALVYPSFMEDSNEVTRIRPEIERWEDIVSIAAGERLIAGLKADGSIVLANDLGIDAALPEETWKDIKKITMVEDRRYGCLYYLYALKEDGTVIGICLEDGKFVDMPEIQGWKDVVEIAVDYREAGLKRYSYVIGLCQNGEVIFSESAAKLMGDSGRWTGLKKIADSNEKFIAISVDGAVRALTECGQVVSAGFCGGEHDFSTFWGIDYKEIYENNVSQFAGIVQVCKEYALRWDGTLLAEKSDTYAEVAGYQVFESIDEEIERLERIHTRIEERREVFRQKRKLEEEKRLKEQRESEEQRELERQLEKQRKLKEKQEQQMALQKTLSELQEQLSILESKKMNVEKDAEQWEQNRIQFQGELNGAKGLFAFQKRKEIQIRIDENNRMIDHTKEIEMELKKTIDEKTNVIREIKEALRALES